MEILTVISDATALFILWLFGNAAVHKLNPANRPYFTALLVEQGWRSNHFLLLAINFTGITELTIGLAIVYPPTRPVAAIAASLLLLGYLALMAYQLQRGRTDLDCGCGGPARSLKISSALLLRNLLLAMLALFCLFPPTLREGYWIYSLLLAFITVLVNLCAEHLIGNGQKLKLLRS